MRVLILAGDPASDPCIPPVVSAVEARGAEAVVVDASGFPAQLAVSFGAGALRVGGRELLPAASAWIRNLSVRDGLPEGMREDHRAAAARQADATLWSLAECLPCFLLDPPEALLGGPRKLRTQQLAVDLGIEVPRTLVSNDPEAIRSFAATCPGELVCKLVDSGSVGLGGEQGEHSFPTQVLSPEDIEDLAGVELSPMIFQERIPKAEELRITVVGNELFVAAVPSGDSVDWRTDPSLVRGFRPYAGLPAPLGSRLLSLMDRLALNFGSIDLIHTPDDRWVFLEVNSITYFDHVERFAGLPISGAVADLLLGRAPPRVLHPGRPAPGLG